MTLVQSPAKERLLITREVLTSAYLPSSSHVHRVCVSPPLPLLPLSVPTAPCCTLTLPFRPLPSVAKPPAASVPVLDAPASRKDALTVSLLIPEGTVAAVEYAERVLIGSYAWKAAVVSGSTATASGLAPNTQYTFRLTLTAGGASSVSGASPYFTTLTVEADEKKRAEEAAAAAAVVPASPSPLQIAEARLAEAEASLAARDTRIAELQSAAHKREIDLLDVGERLKKAIARYRVCVCGGGVCVYVCVCGSWMCVIYVPL